MEYFGFIGKLLKIDLTNESVSTEAINLEHAKNFLGGAGYACRYLFDYIEKGTDPLSSENIFMIMTGPFCLTNAPSFGRFVICSKSPYTDLWGESNSGGFFGPELKKAGYDGIIITGKADNPIYIKIVDENIEIKDASSLWGKGIKKTQKILKQDSNSKDRVLCIGQAGENLVKFSNVNADGRFAGRTGMGAVMGSKNLKAITINGSKFKPNIFNPKDFNMTVKKTLNYILNATATKVLRSYGTSAVVLTADALGDLPIRYWSQGEWNEVYDISGEFIKNNYFVKKYSCFGCPIGCGKIIRNKGQKDSEIQCPEYETIAGFGSMILNNNFESIVMANNLCNDYGLDTISTSSVIAFIYNLYNKRKISKAEMNGLKLNWSNSNAINKLIEKIAFKKGIGKLLAEGSNVIGREFNISKEEIATINNLEVPYHDMRSCYGMAITYAFSPRGACHTTGDAFKVLRKSNEIDFSSLGIKKIKMHSNEKKMAENTARLQNYRALYSSLISCFFSNPPPSYFVELINSLLGFDLDLNKMMLLGERIFNIKRLFNIKMGLTAKNDFVPKILLNPKSEGVVKGKSPNFEKLKKYYYKYRNWDSRTGKPNLSKLKELGLDDLSI